MAVHFRSATTAGAGIVELQSQPYGAGLVVNHHLWQATQRVNLPAWLHMRFPKAYRMKYSFP